MSAFNQGDLAKLREWFDAGCPDYPACGGRLGMDVLLALMRIRGTFEQQQRDYDQERSLIASLRRKGYRVVDAGGNDV